MMRPMPRSSGYRRNGFYENIDISSKTYRERSEQGNINQEGLCQVQVWFDSSYDIETQVHELAMRAGFAEGEDRRERELGIHRI